MYRSSSIADIRKDYSQRSLYESDVEADAIAQFTKWWGEANESRIEEVNAMTLATASAEGRPSARIVLLKDYDTNGFVFFTNYKSRKGKQLLENPFAAIIFFWKEIERQIRIEGSVLKISEEESDAYFYSRPEGSRVGAWASEQSQIIPERRVLEDRVIEYQQKFSGSIPRPPHWGGYLLKPDSIEFWQGRSNRLHDRLLYTRTGETWKIDRLAP